jgi:hypothetical protein
MDYEHMRRTNKIAVIFLFLLSLSLLANAQSQKLTLRLHAGWSSPHEQSIEATYETGFGLELALQKNITLSFDYGFWKSSTREETGGLFDGKLSVTPFLITVTYSFYMDRSFSPYIRFGGGVIFASFEIGDIITIPEVTITQKVNNGIGAYAGLGGIFNLTDYISIFGEGGYLYRKATATTIINDLNLGVSEDSFSLNLSSVLFVLGLKFYI